MLALIAILVFSRHGMNYSDTELLLFSPFTRMPLAMSFYFVAIG